MFCSVLLCHLAVCPLSHDRIITTCICICVCICMYVYRKIGQGENGPSRTETLTLWSRTSPDRAGAAIPACHFPAFTHAIRFTLWSEPFRTVASASPNLPLFLPTLSRFLSKSLYVKTLTVTFCDTLIVIRTLTTSFDQ